jgi:hypothetical protein
MQLASHNDVMQKNQKKLRKRKLSPKRQRSHFVTMEWFD